MARGEWEKVYGAGPERLRSGADKRSTSRSPALSVVVYRAKEPIPRSRRAPPLAQRAGDRPRPPRGRRQRRRRRPYEVTFLAKAATAAGRTSAPTTTRPTASSTTSPTSRRARGRVPRGRARQRRPHARERARASASRRRRSPSRCRPRASACAGPSRSARRSTPEHATMSMRFERSVNGGPFTRAGTRRLLTGLHAVRRHLEPGRRRPVTYRAVLTYAPGRR